MDVQRLRYFIAAAELLHISNAAERLGVSQPTLSQQIRVFEAEIGVPLFTREHRRIALTPAGRVLLEQGRVALAQLDRAASAAVAAADGTGGSVKVGYLQSVIPSHPGQVVSAFREQHPHVQLELVRMGTAQRLDGLRNHTIDVAFLRLRSLNEPDLHFQPLHVEPLVLALSVGHRLAAQRTVRLAQLDGEDLAFAYRAQNPDFHDEVHGLVRAVGAKMRTVHEAWDQIGLLPAVASGEAVSFFSHSMASVLHFTGVVYRDIEPPTPMTGIGFASPRTDRSAAVQAMCGVVDELVERNGWPDPPLPLPGDPP